MPDNKPQEEPRKRRIATGVTGVSTTPVNSLGSAIAMLLKHQPKLVDEMFGALSPTIQPPNKKRHGL